jgi:hypothetical protein
MGYFEIKWCIVFCISRINSPLEKGVRGLYLIDLCDLLFPLVPLFQGGDGHLPTDNFRQIS